jgi:hypothetical protein
LTWKGVRAAGAITDTRPGDHVAEAFAQLETLGEEAALLTATTSHEGVKLGSIRLRGNLVEQKLELLVFAGLLQRATVAYELDARATSEKVVDVLSRNEVPTRVLDEMREALAPWRANGAKAAAQLP